MRTGKKDPKQLSAKLSQVNAFCSTKMEQCTNQLKKIQNFWMHEIIAVTYLKYVKILKFSDTRKICCNLPKIQTKRPNLRVFCQKDANGIANSEHPVQTVGLHCLPRPVCPKTLDHYCKPCCKETCVRVFD